MSYKQKFIEFMVESGVLTFGDFVTKSGRKTPFFINTGNYRTGSQISRLGDFYAECIYTSLGDGFDLLYGPAYKGIPLAVAAASSLSRLYGLEKGFCFNRKETKDHGEGGDLIGMKPAAGTRTVIVEDVVTAGTSVRESVPVINAAGCTDIKAIVISVDRMERGTGELSAVSEIEKEFNIRVLPVVTVKEVVEYLYNREIDGKVIIDDEMMERIREYFRQYGAENGIF